MEEFISPKIPKSDTGSPLLEGYEKYAIPPSLTTEDKIKVVFESLNNVVNKEIELEKKIGDSDKKIEEYKKDIDKQSHRAIEIIGIFSAVLALIIIDVSIIKSVESFLSAILLITALTCSVSIFAILIHQFFVPEDKTKLGKYFWIPISMLIFLVILGIVLFLFNIDINKIKQKTEAPQPILNLQQNN